MAGGGVFKKYGISPLNRGGEQTLRVSRFSCSRSLKQAYL